jgi:cellulose synthase/poly-beta-1,6-N-acetylglucosamine synthase-like glycosyltransferase
MRESIPFNASGRSKNRRRKTVEGLGLSIIRRPFSVDVFTANEAVDTFWSVMEPAGEDIDTFWLLNEVTAEDVDTFWSLILAGWHSVDSFSSES